jgi:outer membrane protein assembly factor BamB
MLHHPATPRLQPADTTGTNFMRRFLLTVLCLSGLASLANADWRQFRGSDTTGVADGQRLPTSWDDERNIAWSAELPGRGLSSPIIVAGRVYVTASSGYRQDRLHVLCFDAEDGGLLWERQFWATGRTASHPKTCVAAPSPASDGERIFALYSSNDLACLDLDGNLLWFRGLTYDYPSASNSLGMSSSPVVVDDTLVVMVENDACSFTTGVDVHTGEERWRIDRPRAANWTSPAIWPGETPADDRVLVQSSRGVVAIDPATGEVSWTYGDGASTIPSTVVADGLAYVPSYGLTVIRPGGSTPEVAEIVWQNNKYGPAFASPIAYDGAVYVINSANVLIRADAATGEEQWRLRLQGPISATPVAAGGYLYFFNEEGLGQVVDPSGEGKVVSEHSFNETILGTPAVDSGALYVRSDGHLWKIASE